MKRCLATVSQTNFQPRPKKPEATVKVVASGEPHASIFVNRFFSYRDGDWVCLFFGYEGKFPLECDSYGVMVHKVDAARLAAGTSSYNKVFAAAGELPDDNWRPRKVQQMYAGSIIQLSQSEGIFETSFSSVEMHYLVEYAKDQKGLSVPKYKPFLSFKSSLELQFAVVKEILSLLS
jgi:hypothetical protein